jgi:5'-nucleotidase
MLPRALRFLLLASLAGLAACPTPAPQPDVPPTSSVPPGAAPSPAEPREKTIAIVGTSDLHGYVEPRQLQVRGKDGQQHTVQRGGLPLLAGYLDNLRARHPVLLLDGGDMFQGTIVSNMSEGQAVVAAYNSLGYHAAAIGNHEFDFGPAGPHSVPKAGTNDDPTGALKLLAKGANFPFLSANLLDRATGQPVAWPNVYPSRIVELAGLRLGVIGALTEDTPRTTNSLNLRDVIVAPIVPAVRAEAERLRQQGVAAIVLTIHEGANCYAFNDPRDTSSCHNNDERIFRIAEQLQGVVDAIVGGHSHAGVAHFAGQVPIVQAFSYGIAFGRIDLKFRRGADGSWQLDRPATTIHPPIEVCQVALPASPPPSQPDAPAASLSEAAASKPEPSAAPPTRRPPQARCDAKLLEGSELRAAEYEGRPVAASANVVSALAPFVERAVARANMPVGVTLAQRVRRNFRNESALGQLLADLMRSGASRVVGRSIDLAVQNGGGLRNDLPAGPLTYTQVFEVMPFDNRLAVVRMTGTQLLELFRRNAGGSHGVLVPSGMRVTVRCSGATMELALSRESGEPIAPEKLYSVALSDFLASGGDNFGGLVPSQTEQATSPNITMFDDVVLRELILEELQRYRGPLLSGEMGPPRVMLPAPRPVRCPIAPGGAPAPPAAGGAH